MKSKIFLTGFMGSGKTYWGKRWAEKNQLHFFDLDEQIEKVAGETIAHIFEKKGEDYFREIERQALREFGVKNDFIMACGGGTPCFFENMQWMNEQGSTLYLEAPGMYIFNRIMDETYDRPLLNKVNPSELLFFIGQKLKEREPFYKQAMYTLDAGSLTINSLSGILDTQE